MQTRIQELRKQAIEQIQKFFEGTNLDEVVKMQLIDVVQFKMCSLIAFQQISLHWSPEQKAQVQEIMQTYLDMLEKEKQDFEAFLSQLNQPA